MTGTASDVHRSSVAYPRAFVRRVASVTQAMPAGRPVTDADLAGLPAAAVRYLRFMNVVGKPRTGSLLAAAHGRFRMRPDGRWMACRAWQLNTVVPVRRLFHMRLRLAPGIAMSGWDTYRDGRGQMRGTLFGAIPVASGTGPHFAASELVTWLNDAVLLAPSMLLDPAVVFREDEDGFRVEVTDGGRTVAARVLVAANGAPRDFWTDDRYADLPGGLVRARWHTPVDGWTVVDGRQLPVGAKAVWQLPGGPFTYAELEFDEAILDHRSYAASGTSGPGG